METLEAIRRDFRWLSAAIVDRLTFAANILGTGTTFYRLAHAPSDSMHPAEPAAAPRTCRDDDVTESVLCELTVRDSERRCAAGSAGDPSRRAIFELLARRPSSVQELTDLLPISRPAVSQHLRVIQDGGLVISQAQGTRRVYRLNPDGVTALRAWLDGVWSDALAGFHKAADTTSSTLTPGLNPDAGVLSPRPRVVVGRWAIGQPCSDSTPQIGSTPHRSPPTSWSACAAMNLTNVSRAGRPGRFIRLGGRCVGCNHLLISITH